MATDIFNGKSPLNGGDDLDKLQARSMKLAADSSVFAEKSKQAVVDSKAADPSAGLSADAAELKRAASSNMFRGSSQPSFGAQQQPNGLGQQQSTNSGPRKFFSQQPGGQGISAGPDGKKTITLTGQAGSDFMASEMKKPGTGLAVQAKATPQDMSALFGGARTDFTKSFSDLTKPITQGEIEAFRAGRVNSPGSGTLSSGDIFGNTAALQTEHTNLLNQIGLYERNNPVAANDVKGLMNRSVATSSLRGRADDIRAILMKRDDHVASLTNALMNAQGRQGVAAINSDSRLGVQELKNSGAENVTGMKTGSAERIAEKNNSAKLAMSEKTNDTLEKNKHVDAMLKSVELTQKHIDNLKSSGASSEAISKAEKTLRRQQLQLDDFYSLDRPNITANVKL